MKRLASLIAIGLVVVSTTASAAGEKLEKNKKDVLAFYELGLNKKDFTAASKFLGARYVQHNPSAVDGPEGFRAYLEYLKKWFPNSHGTVKRAFADGDYVILHVHAVREPGERGSAVVDIFRLEEGKIVEHWDVVQPIPAKPVNANGMF